MKSPILVASLVLGSAAFVVAGQPVQPVEPARSAEISHEVNFGYGASTAARMQVNPSRNADVSGQDAHVSYVLGYALPESPVVRLGVAYDRYDFGFTGPGFIPGALQSVNLVAGVDLKIRDILIRLEAQPGFYGDDVGFNSSTFNIPVVLGFSYLVSKDFQWIGGVSFNPNASNPVMGGVGFRWKMADRWVLNFVPPAPRLEYLASDDLTLYAGGQIINSTFRVNKDFGNIPGYYTNALVDYTEVRAVPRLSWKVSPKGTFDVELGYMAYRDFDYHKIGDNFQTKSGAFYGQMGLRMAF